MRARQAKALVSRFLRKYGREITWLKQVEETNSRGKTVMADGTETVSATVLILKERFNPLNPQLGPVGITHDYTRYVLALPDVELRNGMVITDNHGMRWKLGIVDWFDVGGVSVAKQASLTEVV